MLIFLTAILAGALLAPLALALGASISLLAPELKPFADVYTTHAEGLLLAAAAGGAGLGALVAVPAWLLSILEK